MDSERDSERSPSFKPNSNVKGTGSLRAIVVLYSIPQPSGANRLLLACHKCDGKGSGTPGHWLHGWKMPPGCHLGTLVSQLAHDHLEAPGWGASHGISYPAPENKLSYLHASFAFPRSMLRSGSHMRHLPPYSMDDVLQMAFGGTTSPQLSPGRPDTCGYCSSHPQGTTEEPHNAHCRASQCCHDQDEGTGFKQPCHAWQCGRCGAASVVGDHEEGTTTARKG